MLFLLLLMLSLPSYFIYIHPLIVTYQGGQAPDPFMATASFYTGIALWTIAVLLILYLIFFRSYRSYRRIRDLDFSGSAVPAKIIDRNITRQTRSSRAIKHILECENYAGTTVYYPYTTIERMDEGDRHRIGDTLTILLNPHKTGPAFRLYEKLAPPWRALFLSLALATANIVYAIFAYHRYKDTTDYFNLTNPDLFLYAFHGWLMSPVALLFFVVLFAGIVPRLTHRDGRHNTLLAHGIRTTGTITSLSQTGAYYNEIPQYAIHVQFTDRNGTERSQTIKKTIPFHIDKPKRGDVELLVLPEDPNQVMLYDLYASEHLETNP